MLLAPGYLRASTHPLISGSFILALLVGYELGIRLCGEGNDLAWRTGLDAGLRLLLRQQGMPLLEELPSLAAGVSLLVYCCCRWKERPQEWLGSWAGIVVESFLLALPLMMLARIYAWLNIVSVIRVQSKPSDFSAALLASLGAGIYEELVFRWLLISVLMVTGRWFGLSTWKCIGLALLFSGVLFAFAHHIPPFREPYQKPLFLFRVLAGIYFGLLYWLRGLGIAVGAHASYDILASTYS